jgi:regulator of nonsense transcripts 2
VHLHTRLTPDFLPMLLPSFLAILAPVGAGSNTGGKDADKEREKEDKERLARQRLVLRIVAELALVGAWTEGVSKSAGEVGKVLKGLVGLSPRRVFFHSCD